MRTSQRVIAALIGVSLVLLPGLAHADIYWGDDAGKVGRARLDGTGVNPSFITTPGATYGLTSDGTHLYWANYNAGSIGRSNLDGTSVNQSFIAGVNSLSVAIDEDHIYWAGYLSGAIGRANLDGSGVDQTLVTGGNGPAGIAVDGDHIYWTNRNAGTIGRANLDGSGADQAFISGAGSQPRGIVVTDTRVFWAVSGSGAIGRASLDGTSVDAAFITGANSPRGLAVDGTRIYWSNYLNNTIGRANLDGTNLNQAFVTGAPNGSGLLVMTPQTITFPTPATTPINAGPIALTGSATSGLPVSYTSATPGVCAVTGSTVTLLAGGTCSVTARQSGNNLFIAAPQVQQSFAVTKLPQRVTFPALSSVEVTAGPVLLRASASSRLPVSYRVTTPKVCAVNRASVTLLAPGTCSVRADQPGNGRFSAATGLLRSFQVLPVVSVTAKAKSKTALFVRVTPRLTGNKHWSFKVQVKKKGTWRATSRTYKTQGKRQTRTLNLKKGTYRAAVKPGFGYAGSTSRAVTLKR